MHTLQHRDPDCVDGLPLDFQELSQLREELKLDDAIADGLVPQHEIDQHKVTA